MQMHHMGPRCPRIFRGGLEYTGTSPVEDVQYACCMTPSSFPSILRAKTDGHLDMQHVSAYVRAERERDRERPAIYILCSTIDTMITYTRGSPLLDVIGLALTIKVLPL